MSKAIKQNTKKRKKYFFTITKVSKKHSERQQDNNLIKKNWRKKYKNSIKEFDSTALNKKKHTTEEKEEKIKFYLENEWGKQREIFLCLKYYHYII